MYCKYCYNWEFTGIGPEVPFEETKKVRKKFEGRLHVYCPTVNEWKISNDKACESFFINFKKQGFWCKKHHMYHAIGYCTAEKRREREECVKCKQTKELDKAFRMNFLNKKKKMEEKKSKLKLKKKPKLKLVVKE